MSTAAKARSTSMLCYAHHSVCALILLFAVFLSILPVAASAQTANPETKKVVTKSKAFNLQECMTKGNCVFFIMGAALKNPKMALSIPAPVWSGLSGSDKDAIESALKDHVANARKTPDLYTTRYARIPATAPAFGFMKRNVETMDGYTIYLATKKHPERGGWLTGDELFTKPF